MINFNEMGLFIRGLLVLLLLLGGNILVWSLILSGRG